jgi:hypothetical protein
MGHSSGSSSFGHDGSGATWSSFGHAFGQEGVHFSSGGGAPHGGSGSGSHFCGQQLGSGFTWRSVGHVLGQGGRLFLGAGVAQGSGAGAHFSGQSGSHLSGQTGILQQVRIM